MISIRFEKDYLYILGESILILDWHIASELLESVDFFIDGLDIDEQIGMLCVKSKNGFLVLQDKVRLDNKECKELSGKLLQWLVLG